MNRVVQACQIFFYLAAGCLCLYLINLSHQAAVGLSADNTQLRAGLTSIKPEIDQVLTKVVAMQDDTRRLVLIAGGAVNTLRQIELKERNTLDSQLEIANQTGLKLNSVLDRTDEVVQTLNTTIKGVGQDSHDLLGAAARDLSNPALQETMTNLQLSSQNLTSATLSGSHALQKVDQGVTYEVDQLVKPVSKLKTIGLFIIKAAGKFFGY